MPTKPLHPCNKTGCPVLTGARFCPAHARAYEQQRGTSSQRGYGGLWKEIRLAILRRDPVCVLCRQAPSQHVDHIVAKVKGGRDEPSNLRGLCASCHSRRTALDDGGFGRPTTRASA